MYQVVKYGEQSETITIDDNGSTVTTDEVIHDYNTVKKSIHYKIRIKVNSKSEELKEYMKWSEEIESHPEYRDTDFKIERPLTNIDGAYFVIKCYSVVEL